MPKQDKCPRHFLCNSDKEKFDLTIQSDFIEKSKRGARRDAEESMSLMKFRQSYRLVGNEGAVPHFFLNKDELCVLRISAFRF